MLHSQEMHCAVPKATPHSYSYASLTTVTRWRPKNGLLSVLILEYTQLHIHRSRSLHSVYGWVTDDSHSDRKVQANTILTHVPSNIADDQSRQCLTTTKS